MNVVTVDTMGRKTARVVPDSAPEPTWQAGVELGPPDLSELGLPEEIATRLHNELFNRGIIRRDDARFRRPEVHAALAAALKVDTEMIVNIYERTGNNA